MKAATAKKNGKPHTVIVLTHDEMRALADGKLLENNLFTVACAPDDTIAEDYINHLAGKDTAR